jgi:hypothetical protein
LDAGGRHESMAGGGGAGTALPVVALKRGSY